ncbi:MAG: hypothetical protein HDS97_01240 [Bacteroidales bacterium]|nr:hypothetical protein [Bacteroidales bacterium]
MKKVIYFICYVVGLLLGAGILIFNYQALDKSPDVLNILMIAVGVLFIVPALIQLISLLFPKKDEFGNILPHKWYSTIVAILALLWGIYMLIFPLGYDDSLSISLGISLMLAGLAQIVWIVRSSESTFLRFIIPILTIAVGVIDLTVFNHYPDEIHGAQTAAIISGIMMIIWGVNGFFSLRSKRVIAAGHKAEKEERKTVKEERKAAKEEAKQQAKALEESPAAPEEGKKEESSEPKADSKTE